jgi:hypothetical protein
MRNKKLSLATLAIGSILTLLGPAAASAQDRNNYQQNNRQQNNYQQRDQRGPAASFNNSFQNRQQFDNRQNGFGRDRERQRLERERLEQRRNWDRFHNSYANRNSHRSFNSGYYDNTGCWHSR